MTCSPMEKPKRPLHAKASLSQPHVQCTGDPRGRPIHMQLSYSYMINISRGAGAEPLPEREVSSPTPFFCQVAPPQAAQLDNYRNTTRREGMCLNSPYKP